MANLDLIDRLRAMAYCKMTMPTIILEWNIIIS